MTTQTPTCPHCEWPIHGAHTVDGEGRAWHLRCAEALIDATSTDMPGSPEKEADLWGNEQ